MKIPMQLKTLTDYELAVIRTNPTLQNWKFIAFIYKLTDDLIIEFCKYLPWDDIIVRLKLPDNIIDILLSLRLDITLTITLCKHQIIPENLIRKHYQIVDWECISINQKLSEPFIREFKDKVDWWHISQYQTLSEEFIREFKDKLNIELILKHQTLNKSFIVEIYKPEHKEVLDFIILDEETKKELRERLHEQYIVDSEMLGMVLKEKLSR